MGSIGGGGDALGFGEFPGAVRHGAAVALSDRRQSARAPSASSCGATCRARCCPTMRRRPPRGLVFAGSSSPCCRCRRRATGMCRCASAASRCTCSPAIRRRPPSTGRRIATAGAITTKSASGATTSRAAPAYIRDDEGRRGGFSGKAFIIMGDQNSDPVDGGSLHDAIDALLANPRIDAQLRAAERGRARGQRRRRAAPMPRNAATRASTPPISTTASPATCAWTIYCRRRALRGLRRRRVLARAGRSAARAGVGRPPAAELGSPAGVARHQSRRSSMPTGQ